MCKSVHNIFFSAEMLLLFFSFHFFLALFCFFVAVLIISIILYIYIIYIIYYNIITELVPFSVRSKVEHPKVFVLQVSLRQRRVPPFLSEVYS